MVGLITLADFQRYRRVNRADWACFMAAGLGILFLSITAGIAVGVVLSLLLLISRASEAQLHRLGRAHDAVTYRDISRHDDVVVDPDVLVVRLDGPLFFANANRFHDQLTALLDDCDPAPNVVVADMEAVAQTDTDGADVVTRLAQQAAPAGHLVRAGSGQRINAGPLGTRRCH